jgi:5-formyltetrahydrofolate cyclo-ligase
VTLDQAKQQLRARARAALASVPPEEAAAWSSRVCGLLTESPEFTRARTILGFLPIRGEPDVTDACRTVLNAGKRLCLTRLDWAKGTLTPAAVRSVDAGVVAGRYGIREPAADAPAVAPGEIDLVLVPGLAFDESGRRLGRGAGYYDRFLAPLSVVIVGVAFELQLVPEVPAGSGDVPVGAIVTERRFIRVV